jgi:thymidylate kinase
MIVAFEGPPGSGKTSTIAIMTQELQCLHVPEMLVTWDVERHFTDADYNAHDLSKHQLARDIDNGGLCLMDRSRLSSDAFVYARGKDSVQAYLSRMAAPNTIAIPDHYIYLRISPATSVKRRGPHSDKWRKGDTLFAGRAIDFYDEYFRSLQQEMVTIIDAEPPQTQVLAAIRRSLDKLLLAHEETASTTVPAE